VQVSISDFLTLFSSRTVSWFWTSMPALPLLGAALVALTVSTMLGTFWPACELEELPVLGLGRSDPVSNYKLWPIWVWIYCIVW
jgi:H+-transporting ATPase